MSNDVTPFERIQRVGPSGNEFLSGREFAQALDYTVYRNFESVNMKVHAAFFNSVQRVEHPLVEIAEMVAVGSGTQRPVKRGMKA